jgi:hypothetical protein
MRREISRLVVMQQVRFPMLPANMQNVMRDGEINLGQKSFLYRFIALIAVEL